MSDRRTFLGLLAAGGALAVSEPSAAASPALRAVVEKELARFMAQHRCPSAVVGVSDSRSRYVLGAGDSGQPDGAAPNGSTVYQLGSITKTFTGLATAIEVAAGRRGFADPLARYLPEWMPLPAWHGREITLGHIVTHTSGLPSLPPAWARRLEPVSRAGIALRDPWALFTVRDMADALRTITLTRAPGTRFEYSNFAMGLLGQSLAVGGEAAYESVIGPRIAAPLGLRDTGARLTPAQSRRKAMGHDRAGAPTPDWHLGPVSGAGALYGTVDDLLRYAHAHVALAPARLAPALRLTRETRFTAGELAVTVNWMVGTLASGRRALWHNGETGGFRSFCAFCPAAGTAVAVLIGTTEPAAGDAMEAMAARVLDSIG
jgi:CubicO group peptidase (beta-lactamase class C family)